MATTGGLLSGGGFSPGGMIIAGGSATAGAATNPGDKPTGTEGIKPQDGIWEDVGLVTGATWKGAGAEAAAIFGEAMYGSEADDAGTR